MHAGTMLILAAMVQGNQGSSQAVDTVPANLTDSGHLFDTRVVLRSSLLGQFPLDDPREELTLVPGIVRRGTALGIGAGTGLRLRGGALDGAAVYIDGAPIRNLLTGVPGVSLATNAIDSISVTRGPAGVELEDAGGGGVLEYTTRTGGPRLDGHLVAATDAPFGDGSSVGFNRFSAAAGGPAGPRATWFLSGEVTGQRSAYRGIGAADQPAFVWGGVDTVVSGVTVPTFTETTGLERPLDWITQRRATGKVSLSFGASTVMLTGLVDNIQQRFFPGADVGDTALFSGARATSRLAVASWTLPLGSDAHPRALHLVVALGHDGASSGLLTPAAQASTAHPALGIEWSSLRFLGSDSIQGTTAQIVRNVRSNAGLRTPFLGQTSLRNAQPYRLNPYGLAAGGDWPTTGSNGPLTTLSENRFDARAWIEWSLTVRQHLRAGADYTRASDAFYRADLISQTDLDAWTAEPRRLGLFATDRITWDRLVLDFGARFDHFTPGGALPLVPGRIFSNPAWNFASGTDDTAYTASIGRVLRDATGKNAISPRASAGYAVSPRVTLRIAVGQVVEPPAVGDVFGRSNTDLATTGTSLFGRDVRYLKSTTGDLGVTASLTPLLAARVDGYVSRLALYAAMFAPFDDPANPGRTLNLVVLSPVDTITAHGVEASVDWRPLTGSSGRFVYSWDRRAGISTQALGAIAVYSTGPAHGDVAVSATLRAQSGVAFIPEANVGSGDVVFEAGAAFLGPLATAHLPWARTVDLRLAKHVRLSQVRGSLYADLRNVLNFRNLVGAFTETRTGTNSLFQASVLSPEFANLHIEAQANGTLLSGNAVDLRPDCSTWTGSTAGPVDCAALRQVERRFGNGDGVYDLTEQTAAFDAYYEAFFGSSRFYAPGRAARIGVELSF